MAEASKSALTESEAAHVEFIKMAKVAVATALIRSKPESVTGQQYAAFLQQKIHSDWEKWEEKCKKLEEKLLQLKMQVLSEVDCGFDDLSLVERVPSCIFTTPPSSSDKKEDDKSINAFLMPDSKANFHVKFLENVTRLKFTRRFLEKAAESTIACSTDESRAVVQGRIICEQTGESVQQVLDFVKEAVCKTKATITSEVLLHSVSCIVRLLVSFEGYLLSSVCEDDRKALDIAAQVVEKCCNLSMELQAFIMSATDITAYRTQNLCSEVIFHLAQCPSLCPGIVRQLIQGILAVSTHLKMTVGNSRTTTEDDNVPPAYILFENVCYLFRILESILNQLLQGDVRTALKPANGSAVGRQDTEKAATRTCAVANSDSAVTRFGEDSLVKVTALSGAGKGSKQKRSHRSDQATKKAKKVKQNMTGNIMDFINSVKDSQARNVCVQSQVEESTPEDENSATTRSFIAAEPDTLCRGPGTSSDNDFAGLVAVATPEFLCSVRVAMENALLHTCDHFPLFSRYVWKISCLVEEIFRNMQ